MDDCVKANYCLRPLVCQKWKLQTPKVGQSSYLHGLQRFGMEVSTAVYTLPENQIEDYALHDS